MSDHRRPSHLQQISDKEMRRIRRDIRRVRIEPEDEQPIGNAARGIVIAFGWSILIWASLFALWAVAR